MRINLPIVLFLCLALALFAGQNSFAQSSYLQVNDSYTSTVDRYEILSGKVSPTFFTSVKPYTRKAVAQFVDSMAKDSVFRSNRDWFNRNYLSNDNWEFADSALNQRKGLLKYFYRVYSDFFHVKTKSFDLHVNPVLYLQGGYEPGYSYLFLNSRGLEARGMIDNKIGFYTYFSDNQALFPEYVKDVIDSSSVAAVQVVPGEFFGKTFKTGQMNDFISARGHLTFNVTKHIGVQFGYDKNFIGHGYRSLLLSDNAAPYTFVKINTKIWKLNYMNLFTEMNAGVLGANNIYPKKYVIIHHLSANVFRFLNIGVFESVVYKPRDADSTHIGNFDISYANPIIFYRAIEQGLGSSDNAMIGMDFKAIILKSLSLYGQVVLDEFVLSEIMKGKGWWANKFAIQGGLKYINAFTLKNLDLQAEVNIVRPYTYQHFDNYTNYTHYGQAIAHPLGANFTEVIGIVRYQPIKRMNVTAKFIYADIGKDSSSTGLNYGGDLSKNYSKHPNEYGNVIGQGVKTRLLYGSLNLSYMLFHNFFIDASLLYRNSNSAWDIYDRNSVFFNMAIRWNLPVRQHEF